MEGSSTATSEETSRLFYAMTAMKSSKFSEVNESHKQPYCQESKYGGRRKRSSLLLIVAIEVLGALAAEAYTIKYFDCNNAEKYIGTK